MPQSWFPSSWFPSSSVHPSRPAFSFLRSIRLLALLPALAIVTAPPALHAQTAAASATQLSVTSAGSAVTSISSGTIVSLTATVTSGAAPVTTGQVSFCDATAANCLGLHQLAIVQLNASGVAVYRFKPGPGSQRFKAVFAGTNTVATSASSQSSLTVTPPAPTVLATTTTMTRSGSWGNYTVGATVTEIGSTTAPAGTISFLDTNHANTVLASASLGAATPGIGWLSGTISVTAGLAPSQLATGDFNEDGIPDVATTVSNFSTENNVAIFLGNGNGTFTGPTLTSPTGTSPAWVLVADFNGDGHQDLAVQNAGNETATIFLGKGDGTFATGATFAINDSLTPFVAGDFNGDGKVDLVSAGFNGTDITIYYGNGDGTFSLGSTVTFPVFPTVLLAADFNGDGKTDLIVGTQTQGVSVLLGKGDGTFTTPTSLTIPGYASSLLAGDFNGDGKLDLAVGNDNQTQGRTAPISIFLGNGDGTFNAVATSTSVPSPLNLAMADLNQDGIPDIVTSNFVSSGVSVLLGKGDGTFALSPTAAPTSTVPGPTIAVDLNGDGIPDLVTVTNLQTITINLTQPTVTTSTPAITLLPGAPGAHLVDASFPGSTFYASSTSGTYLLYGQPPATATTLTLTAAGTPVTTIPANTVLTLTATITSAGTPIPSGQVNFCDATAPSCTDIHLLGSAQLTSAGTATFRFTPGPGAHSYKAVVLESAIGLSSASAASPLTVQAAPHVSVATNTTIAQSGPVGDYTLTATVNSIGGTNPMTGTVSFEDTSNANAVLVTAPLGTGTASIAWVPSFTVTQANQGFLQFAGGDFNGDGHPDVAMINPATMTVSIYLGHGDGTYTTATPLTLTTYTSGVVAADFNGDGILDLAVSSIGSGINQPGYLAIYLGHGDGTFTLSPSAPTVGNFAHVFTAADINGDGKLDLVLNEASVRILFGNGDGTFSQGPANSLPTAAAVADLNGDGIPDIVSGNNDAYGAIYLGNGDGTFRAAPALPVLMDEPVVSVGDFNGDGIPDLVLNSQFDGTFAILLGKGDGSFTLAPNQPTTPIGRSLSNAVGDFNHDGKLDILVGTSTGNTDLNLFLGNGDGTFNPGPTDAQFYPAAAILVQDVNGDGTPDLVLDYGKMSVLLTEPTQTATATATGVSVSTAGTHAVDAVYPGDTNYLTSTSTTTPIYAQAATPVPTPAPGTYTSIQTLTLADPTPGATIYYSLDSPTGGNGSFAPYTGSIPLNISGTYSLQVYATATGFQQSATTSFTYVLNLPVLSTPVATPAPRAYASAQSVTLTETTPGATIYYTTNGQFPTTSSTLYTGPIPITANETILAYAVERGYTDSAAFYGQYVITAAPSITWPTPASIAYGTALGNTQLDASTTIPGTFTYSPAAGTVLTVGTHTLTATFTPTNTLSYPNATATVTLNVTSTAPTITWPTPAAIPFGTPLSAAQLDATTTIPGTFTYTPAAGAILPIGNQTLSVTFTPTDTADYTTATASVVLPVVSAAPVLTALSPTHVAAGTSAFTLTVNGSGFVPTSVVVWGSTPLTTQVVSATQLTASVPASAIATPGTVAITVQTPAPGGGSSAALQFEVDSAATEGAAPPTIPTTTETVAKGSAATYTVTLPSSVISASVTCLNLPANATCAYANGAVTITTAANTPAGTYAVTVVFTETLQGAAAALFFLPFLLTPLAIKRSTSRRMKGMFLTLAALTVMTGALFLTGCGGSGSGSGGGPTTHTATSSATITLVVQ